MLLARIQDTLSENISLTEDLQWLNKLGLLRTNLLSQQNRESLAINSQVEKQNYSHFYDPSRINFYFTDFEKSPLKKAEIIIDNQTLVDGASDLNVDISVNNKTFVDRNVDIFDKPSDVDYGLETWKNETEQNTKISVLSSLPYPVWIAEKSQKKVFHTTEKVPRKVKKQFKNFNVRKLDNRHTKFNSVNLNILSRLKNGIRFYKNRFSNMISKKHLIEIAAFAASVLVMLYL